MINTCLLLLRPQPQPIDYKLKGPFPSVDIPVRVMVGYYHQDIFSLFIIFPQRAVVTPCSFAQSIYIMLARISEVKYVHT